MLLARYALNKTQLSKEMALLRFLKVLQIARRFESKSDTGCENILSFIEYLNQNLPDYNEGRCPREGNCLASELKLTAQLTFSGKPSVVMLDGASIMRHLGCEQKKSFVFSDITGNVAIPNFGLQWLKPLFRIFTDSWGGKPFLEATDALPRIFLTLVKNQTNGYQVTLAPNTFDKTVARFKAANVNIADVFLYEALWEQLSQGGGPLCFCDSDIREDCPYRPVLAKLWQQTEPDPDWEQNWKKSEPPECIRSLL
jgi:hypothetical protein